jgi:cytochrome c oxidase subunit 2
MIAHALASALTALATIAPGPTGLPEQASSEAQTTDFAYNLVFWISVVAFTVIAAVMTYFVIKYRRRSPDQKTSPISGNLKIEVIWTVIPLVTLIIIFWVGFKGWMSSLVPPKDSIEVRVTAFKWGWEFQYPRHSVSQKELVVPIHRPVKLIMSSKDVIHSFYVPAFRIKRDVLPERYTVLWFKATKLGTFDVRCAEYCGTRHSKMFSRIHVWPEDKWREWYDKGGPLSAVKNPIQLGKLLFDTKCSSCHSNDKSRKVVIGPPLYGIYGRQEVMADGEKLEVDDNYLRESIVYPQKRIVKGYENQNMNPFPELTEKQINALVDYLKTLGRESSQPVPRPRNR